METTRKEQLVRMIAKADDGYDKYKSYFTEYYYAYKAFINSDALRYLEESGKSATPFYYIMNKLQRIRADFIEAYFTNKQFAKIIEKPSLKATYFNPILNQFVPFELTNNYSEMNKKAINALQNAVDYYTIDDEKCKLYQQLSVCIDNLLIYGTSAVKVWWDNGIKIEAIDMNKIKFDPGAKDFDNNKYFVHEIDIMVDEIIKYQEQGIFEQDIELEKIAPDWQNNKHKRITLQEVYELEADNVFVSTVFNKEIILRDKVKLKEDNPITVGTIRNQIIDPDGDDDAVRTYGDSIVAPLIPLQKEITVLRNQQMDIVDRQLNPRYITNDKSLNPFDFFNQKQQIIQGDPNKIKELQTPNIKDSVFNVDRLAVEGQEAIGVTDYNSGNASNKQLNNTATGISILTSESNKILAHYLRGFNETEIKKLFRKIVDLVWMYGDAKFFYGIDRTQVLEYQVGVDVGLGATNKEQQLNAKTIAHGGMMKFAELTQDPMRMERAEKFYYKEILPLLGVENFEEYYNEHGTDEGNFGNFAGQQGMGLPGGLLGTAENGLTATSQPNGYGGQPLPNGTSENY